MTLQDLAPEQVALLGGLVLGFSGGLILGLMAKFNGWVK